MSINIAGENNENEKKKFPVWIIPVAVIVAALIIAVGIIVGIKAGAKKPAVDPEPVAVVEDQPVVNEPVEEGPSVDPSTGEEKSKEDIQKESEENQKDIAKYTGAEMTEETAKQIIVDKTHEWSNWLIDDQVKYLSDNNGAYKDYAAVVAWYYFAPAKFGGTGDEWEKNGFILRNFYHDENTAYTWDELLNCVNYELFEGTKTFNIDNSYNDILNKWSHNSAGYLVCLGDSDFNITKIVYPANEGRTQKFDDYNCDCEVYFTTGDGVSKSVPTTNNANMVAYFASNGDSWSLLDIDFVK